MRKFKKGDILEATKKSREEGYHPIIFLEDINGEEDFIGAMITHSSIGENIKMKSSHFNKTGNNPEDFGIWCSQMPSYLVIYKFIKLDNWGPFDKVNSLTDEGIKFVEQILNGKQEITFENYKTTLEISNK